VGISPTRHCTRAFRVFFSLLSLYFPLVSATFPSWTWGFFGPFFPPFSLPRVTRVFGFMSFFGSLCPLPLGIWNPLSTLFCFFFYPPLLGMDIPLPLLSPVILGVFRFLLPLLLPPRSAFFPLFVSAAGGNFSLIFSLSFPLYRVSAGFHFMSFWGDLPLVPLGI